MKPWQGKVISATVPVSVRVACFRRSTADHLLAYIEADFLTSLENPDKLPLFSLPLADESAIKLGKFCAFVSIFMRFGVTGQIHNKNCTYYT
jgi:hypothetical protein